MNNRTRLSVLTAIFILLLTLTSCNTGNGSATKGTSVSESENPSETSGEKAPLAVYPTEMNMQAGEISFVESNLAQVTFESDNEKVITVNKEGRVCAQDTGEATVTVRTTDGKEAQSCKIKVRIPDGKDRFEILDFKNARTVSTGVYKRAVWVNGEKEILFSPEISDHVRRIAGNSFANYEIYLRFTLQSGEKPVVFPSVRSPLKQGKGKNIDIVLQGKNNNSGFCPQAGEAYMVQLALVKKGTLHVALQSVYPYVPASADCRKSPYYHPTDPSKPFVPNRKDGDVLVRFEASGEGRLEGISSQLLDENHLTLGVKAIPERGYCFAFWTDGNTSPYRSREQFKEDVTLTAVFVRLIENGKIPSLHIYTDSGESVTSKDYRGASVYIHGAENPEFNLINKRIQIRGRGNSSFEGSAPDDSYRSKNSYRIKFDESVQLLGIGEVKKKDWILQANKFDPTALRNQMVWSLAEKMGTIPYFAECTWVQLYVNGAYRGMYMAVEQLEMGEDRVELDDRVNSSDKGYLIEIDFRGNNTDKPYFYIEGYGPNENRDPKEFVVKSYVTEQDVAFIKKYIEQCHKAFMTGKRQEIEKYVDMASFVDMFILEEWSKDVDAGSASFYLQKAPGGKLCFTAPWDFDFGFGNFGKSVSLEGFVSGPGMSGCTWHERLLNCLWFKKEVQKRMTELEGAYLKTMEEIKAQAEYLKADSDENNLFWHIYGNHYHMYIADESSTYLYSYEDHIDYLTSWAEERYALLKDELLA